MDQREIYLVTIRTALGISYFGEIRQGIMRLSEQGCMAWYYWRKQRDRLADTMLSDFIVMPNHVHGILCCRPEPAPVRHSLPPVRVEVLPYKASCHMHEIHPVIVRYKSRVAAYCLSHGLDFAWQLGYYHQQVSDAEELPVLQRYIERNPLDWEPELKNLF